MAKRPEGLSPCYSSLASPDIPESHSFKWTPHVTQNGATINIYASDATTLLKTYAVSGTTTEVNMASVGYTFSIGTSYYWTVTVTGAVSIKARFEYDAVPIASSISWTYIPKPGEVVVANTYFEEMKSNITKVIGDYDNAPETLVNNISELFTDEIVPSRDDFAILESVVNYLSTQLEDYQTVDIDGPVKDSLGVSDLEVVRNHIDRLLTVPPKAVKALAIDVPEPTMYQILDLNSSHDAKKDPTIDLTWTVSKVPSYNGTFTFTTVSPSKDIRYYVCSFSYGPSNNPFISELYFKAEDMIDGTSRSFDTDWDGLYTASTIGLAKQALQVIAYDHRGNRSSEKTVVKVFGSNFKAPLGVEEYQVEYQKAPMGDKDGPYPDRRWYSVYKGTLLHATHKVSGGEGTLYYRVRAVDYSGLITDWEYVTGITFDPLTPPAVPKNFHATEIATNYIKLDWDTAARAETYELVKWLTPPTSIYTGANTYGTATGLTSNSSYNFYVRAVNRVGKSDWAGITIKTKSSRATKSKKATKGDSWNTGYNSVRTGRRISGSFWRHESGLVYQGEWCEIKGSPNYIGPPNQCWGKHKGMWIMDDDWWRSTLAGKDIIKVELWLQRKGKAHGYYNDQVPTFWLHNHNDFPGGEPSFFGKFQPGKEFDLGESGWVTLPNWYGEYIRDNKAKGIGLYRDNWGKLPYVKFYANAELRITYE